MIRPIIAIEAVELFFVVAVGRGVSVAVGASLAAFVLTQSARVAVEVEGLGELHLDDQLTTRNADLFHRVADEREVAGEDPIADVVVGCAEAEQARVALERHDVLERREPHGFRHLGPQELSDCCPHLFCVVHLHLLPRRRTTVHIVVHNCG